MQWLKKYVRCLITDKIALAVKNTSVHGGSHTSGVCEVMNFILNSSMNSFQLGEGITNYAE
jgi:hypothetical protein